jgi:hypothetical protein
LIILAAPDWLVFCLADWTTSVQAPAPIHKESTAISLRNLGRKFFRMPLNFTPQRTRRDIFPPLLDTGRYNLVREFFNQQTSAIIERSKQVYNDYSIRNHGQFSFRLPASYSSVQTNAHTISTLTATETLFAPMSSPACAAPERAHLRPVKYVMLPQVHGSR